MEESSFKNDPQEKMQLEENNLDTLPRKKQCTAFTSLIGVSDSSNMRNYKTVANARFDAPRMVIMKNPEKYTHLTCSDAMKLRKKNPSFIPVTLEKDAMSDIPDIGTKIYHVHGDTTLGEFVDVIRLLICLSKEKPIFVFLKNTEPPTGALMSAIDEQNKDEDGFLHITYSGEEKNVNARAQAEKNYPDPVPMIVENADAMSHKPNIEEQKNSSEKKRKKIWPITYLDPWNRRVGNMTEEECLEKDLRADPGMDKEKRKFIKRLLKTYKQRAILEAGQMRQERPNWVPVCVKKDAKSDIPDIGMTKFHVPGDMPLGKFLDFIRLPMRPRIYKPIYGLFKNTEPCNDALIAEIDEENKDEDGYLHMTYSGEEKESVDPLKSKNALLGVESMI